MEQARVFLAIALTLLVFILWEVFFVEREIEKIPQQNPDFQTEQKEESKNVTPYEIKRDETSPQTLAPKSSETSVAALSDTLEKQKEQETRINTPLYSVVISSKGAAFTSFVLKNYKENVGDDAPRKELISKQIPDGTLLLSYKENSLPGLSKAVFSSPVAGQTIDVYSNSRSILFSYTSPEGVVFEKEFVFTAKNYLISMVARVKNGSSKTLDDRLMVTLNSLMDSKGSRYGFEGPSALVEDSVNEINVDDIQDEKVTEGKIGWVALESIYFISSVIPKTPKIAAMELDEKNESLVQNSYVEPPRPIGPGQQTVYEYDLFFGPKSLKLLRKIDNGLEKAVNFGMFDIIAKPCLWLMNFIYDYIPNYGVAIIILTIFVKILLWPLGNKSYKSMNEMKKLQPLMAEIREKYKDDKKKMNQETMALYKTYKINPMGGCLPMAMQIPVFLALYRMLYEAIELRHAPFLLWINDLSAPDRLFRFDFSIPLMEPPYGIPVLTLIMGGTMFLQQKMTPTAGDPTQAKLMTFMPLLFTVIFVNFSSGLVLYWLVNNLLSIGQQYYIQKKN